MGYTLDATLWRGGRVVEGTCLENRTPSRVRRFESCPLRSQNPSVLPARSGGFSCFANGLLTFFSFRSQYRPAFGSIRSLLCSLQKSRHVCYTHGGRTCFPTECHH